MCFGGGEQPAAPTNPAPYDLDKSETAVTQEVTRLSMDDEDLDAEAAKAKPTQAKNKAAPTVTGGTGVNDAALGM